MEEKNLTEKESLELIARMISKSKKRLEIGDGNVFLYWGTLSVVIGIAVWVAVATTLNPAWNGLWGLMGIGALFNYKKAKEAKERGYTSYTDKVCSTIWISFGFICLAALIICTVLTLCYDKHPWFIMFITAVLGCGSGCIATGAVIEIRSLIFGGIFSSIFGCALVACLICGISVTWNITMALFILSFILMMVIPGLEMRYIAKKEQ